jgi:branched-chain amino acid transport system permease protein
VTVSEPGITASKESARPDAPGSGTSGVDGRPALRWLRGRLPEYGPPVYRRHVYLQVVVFVILMAIFGAAFSTDSYRLGVMVTAFTYAIAAIGLYFAYSLGGLFAFSQAAFMGLGAYTSAKIGDEHGFLIGFVSAIVVSFVVALVVGLILRRA